MAIKLKSIDPKSSLRKWTAQFSITASNNTSIFLNVPFNCSYDKALFGRAVASADAIISISGVLSTLSLATAGTIVADTCGVIGSVEEISACNTSFGVTQNSLLHITCSGTTDGAGVLQLVFTLDENKEK